MSDKSHPNRFSSSLSTDVARPSRFEVIIPVPTKLLRYTSMVKRLTLRCETCTLPGLSLHTEDRSIYGTPEKIAYLKNHEDLDVTFICSGDMKEKMFFDAWMNLIVPNSSKNPEFQDNYTTTINITHYGVDNTKTYSVDVINAFPINVAPIEMSWDAKNQYMRLPVKFSYLETEPVDVRGYVTEVKNSFVSDVVDVGEALLSSIVEGISGKNSDTADNWKMTDIAKRLK